MSYPDPPAGFDPLLEMLPSRAFVWRCHSIERDPVEPNSTVSPGRFRPVYDTDGSVVPTCYAADSEDAAIAEGPFHDLPVVAGPKHLARAVTDILTLSHLTVTRDLSLVSFRRHGLRRVGATQGTLIEPGQLCYPASAAWGQAAYNHESKPDGILWVSRQFPGGAAMLLFWDRCGSAIEQSGASLPLAVGRGLELLSRAANAANVVIVSE
jgi:hypothetical protein